MVYGNEQSALGSMPFDYHEGLWQQ
jgi:hypothetical protein